MNRNEDRVAALTQFRKTSEKTTLDLYYFCAQVQKESLVILLHSIIVNPFTWFILRIVTGFSMVSLYTVAESWLNDRSSNKNRGSVLSIYMIVLYGSMAL